jgi:hypothetical protein
MTIAEALFSLLINPQAPWRADWIWGIPLIVLTVMLHVLGLGIIQHNIVPVYGLLLRGRHAAIGFALVMGGTTLLATCLHAIEAAIWGATYLFIGALPDSKLAMLYSMGAMTTYGHENLHVEAHWQMLGTMEALDGWLLFGLTTAFLFALIDKCLPPRLIKH